MNISDRLLQYLEFKGITKNKFYSLSGLSNGFLVKRPNIGADKIERIVNLYPDLSLYWLICGKGEMIIKNEAIPKANEPSQDYLRPCRLCAEKDDVISALREANSALHLAIDKMTSPGEAKKGYKQTG